MEIPTRSSSKARFPRFVSKVYDGSRSDAARRVRDILRIQIVERGNGPLPFNSKSLPSEDTLADMFGVSRNVVREALDLLRREGLIDRIPGVGTFLTGHKICQELDKLKGLAESLEGYQVSVENEILACSEVPANTFVAQKLRLHEGSAVVFIERLRIVEGRPLSLNNSYLSTEFAHAFLGEDLSSSDLLSVLEKFPHASIGWAKDATEAVAAEESVAKLLQVPTGSPLLLLQRMVYLEDGTPFDLEVIRYRGDRIRQVATRQRDRDPSSFAN